MSKCIAHRFVFILCLSVTTISHADNSVESFFKGLEGKWHGEAQGLYKIDMSFGIFQTQKPWQLQTGDIIIVEGEEIKYQFELSKNSVFVDKEDVYFLRIKNLANQETQLFTLSSRTNSRAPLSFWRHFVETKNRNSVEYISANAIKIFKTGGELTFGFASGNVYCKESEKTSLCATDGWVPYAMKKVSR